MLGKFARGMVLAILAMLIVVYIVSGFRQDSPPPVPSNRIIGYMSA